MRSHGPISLLASPVLGLLLSAGAPAQVGNVPSAAFVSSVSTGNSRFTVKTASGNLSPELALAAYERGLKDQAIALAGYTATSVIDAELPESSQKAEFELKRHYVSPGVLEFTPVRSSGDKFVRTNVIVRLLESEVEHVRKREQHQTAIDSSNYKFSYKGTAVIHATPVHVFEVKPRQKRVGLFKGKIYVDAVSARLVRAEGRIVKSPSFFLKKIDFVQDYATVDGFTLLSHLHSEAETRLIGKTVVDVTQRDYQPQLANAAQPGVETAALDGSN